MRTNQIGETGLAVTRLGFGGASIGNMYYSSGDEEAASAIDAAWTGGIRYFDTAPHYGLGLSERRLGATLGQHARSDFVISTKVGRLLTPNPTRTGTDLDFGGFDVPDDVTRTLDYSADGVQRSLDQSLRRMGMDFVDIVYVHDPDDYVDQVIRETFPALVKLREEGVIRAIGAGMNHWRPLVEFVNTSDIDIVMLAGRWTLLDRSGQPLLSACAAHDVAVIAAAPFNSGLLSRPRPTSDSKFDYQTASPELLSRARQLAALCANYGVELPEVAINFALRDPNVVSVVAGFRTATHARDGTEWMDKEIPEALWEEIDDLLHAADAS
jgi:D-threo-aldose 1-dehydrogenase